jgi:signal peptidase I
MAKSSTLKRLFVAVGLLAIAGVFAFVIVRVVFLEAFKMPSGSMLPTFPVGAHVTAHKREKPERGAVMVFRYPEHRDQMFVKRIVALPGEKLEVKQQRVFINGWEVPRCEVGPWEYADAADGSKHSGTLWLEHLGAVSFLVMHDTSFLQEYQGPYQVKDGEYFVLGDNRENSHDSRMWFGGTGGGVPSADMLGRVTSADETKLPPGAEKLRAALDGCMAKKPAKTAP